MTTSRDRVILKARRLWRCRRRKKHSWLWALLWKSSLMKTNRGNRTQTSICSLQPTSALITKRTPSSNSFCTKRRYKKCPNGAKKRNPCFSQSISSGSTCQKRKRTNLKKKPVNSDRTLDKNPRRNSHLESKIHRDKLMANVFLCWRGSNKYTIPLRKLTWSGILCTGDARMSGCSCLLSSKRNGKGKRRTGWINTGNSDY
jgi:hypothetical protein